MYNLEKLEVAFGSIMERWNRRRASSRSGASETSAEGREWNLGDFYRGRRGEPRRFLQRTERGASEISTEDGEGSLGDFYRGRRGEASETSAEDGEKRPRSFSGREELGD